jgi:plastocyanin
MFLLLAGCATGPADLSVENDTFDKSSPKASTVKEVPADLIAENNKFNRSSLRVRTGEKVSVVFENRDNTTHNFAIYSDRDATQMIFQGEALDGPGTITYTFTAPNEPGSYYFQCDFHPATMNGRFTVGGTSS